MTAQATKPRPSVLTPPRGIDGDEITRAFRVIAANSFLPEAQA
uniref:Uncharacterized protein n=1 Tax=Caulobacter sp. (strain K31) TaxID=366602 RepID=B0SVV7_CAUSK